MLRYELAKYTETTLPNKKKRDMKREKCDTPRALVSQMLIHFISHFKELKWFSHETYHVAGQDRTPIN